MEALRIIAGIVAIPGLLCIIVSYHDKDKSPFWFFTIGTIFLICIALRWI